MWVAQHYRFLMLSALLCYATEFQVHKKMGSEKKKFRQQQKKRRDFLAFFPYNHDPKRSNIQKKKFSHLHVHTEIYHNLSEFQSTFLLAILLDFLSDKIWP